MIATFLAMHMVQVAVVQIIHRGVGQHCGVAAVLAMGVGVICVGRAAHGYLLSNRLYI
jgi:hypothetical protein